MSSNFRRCILEVSMVIAGIAAIIAVWAVKASANSQVACEGCEAGCTCKCKMFHCIYMPETLSCLYYNPSKCWTDIISYPGAVFVAQGGSATKQCIVTLQQYRIYDGGYDCRGVCADCWDASEGDSGDPDGCTIGTQMYEANTRSICYTAES